MGQASRRGTFEDRRLQAIQREENRLSTIRIAKEHRLQQERAAYRTMVWWQEEMTERRHKNIMRRKMESNMQWASLYGMLAGMGWNSMDRLYRK